MAILQIKRRAATNAPSPLTYPDGKVVTSGYDLAGRLTSVMD